MTARLVKRFTSLLIVVAAVLLCTPGPASAAGPHWWQWGDPQCNKKGADGKYHTGPCGGGSLLPSIGDCKSAPTPQMPGDGFTGNLDPGPTPPNPAAVDVYAKVGYPPEWHTYDLGSKATLCIDAVHSTNTQIANWGMGLATSAVAAENTMHRIVSNPTFLDVFDPVLQQGVQAVHDAIWTPYIVIIVCSVGIIILLAYRTKKLSTVAMNVAAMLFCLGAATVLFDYPVVAGHAADKPVAWATNNIDQHLGRVPAGVDPSTARASTLVNNVAYRNWLRGELGSADSLVAKKYGMQLLASQTYTYDEAAQINKDPKAATAITKKKAQEFKQLAATIKTECPSCYQYLTGAHDRIGAAAIADGTALATVPFMLMSDFVRLCALVIWRGGIIFGPILLMLAMIPAFRRAMITAISAVPAGLFNSVVFAFGSALNMLITTVLLDPNSKLPNAVAVILCVAAEVLLWIGFKPARRMGRMASAAAMQRSIEKGTGAKKWLRRGAKVAGGAVLATGGFLAGEEHERGKEEDEATDRHEGWTRPDGDREPASYRNAAEPVEREPARGLPAGAPVAEPATPPGTDIEYDDRPWYGPTTVTQREAYAPESEPPAAIGTGQAALPAAEQRALPAVSVVADEPEIYMPGEPRNDPGRNLVDLRGDPEVVDGRTTYRVWSSDTQSFHEYDLDAATTFGNAGAAAYQHRMDSPEDDFEPKDYTR